MEQTILNTKQKALQINLNRSFYGTFAEIGAGQEVARFFFQAGSASGTIAKSMSAYDMVFSDEIYGAEASGRFVCESRLQRMLDREYDLLLARLSQKRTEPTSFFVLANTVATGVRNGKGDGHGWVGVKFQPTPGAPANQVRVHLRLLESVVNNQQKTLGIAGVNLLFACLHYHRNPRKLVSSLMENIEAGDMEIDMVHFSGPVFEEIDNRLMSLQLVKNNMTDVVMVRPDGKVAQPADVLYKRHALILRGQFRPVTLAHKDMLERAVEAFCREESVDPSRVLLIAEMSTKRLGTDHSQGEEDFLARARIFAALGYSTMITNYQEFYRIAAFCQARTKKLNGLILGASHLQKVFDERYYKNLSGGMLEALGILFNKQTKLYVYPALKDQSLGESASARVPDDSRIMTCTQNLGLDPSIEQLFQYFWRNGWLQDLTSSDLSLLSIHAKEALNKLRAGDHSWEQMVPETVARLIKENGYFHFQDRRD